MNGITGYDFAGWATKNDLKCTDGRIIRNGAFKESDGKKVPLVWNHRHESVTNILGHALLENRNEGVYAYCFLNDSPDGQSAKKAIQHGDVESLSIFANNVSQVGPDIVHGNIREVSLVMLGANPGAFIESVVAHGVPMDEDEDEGIFFNGEGLILTHSAEDEELEAKMDKESGKKSSEKTVGDVYDAMTEEQKVAVAVIVGQALADAKDGSSDDEDDDKKKKEDGKVYHSAFERDKDEDRVVNGGVIIHSEDLSKIMTEAKTCGSLKKAVTAILGDSNIIAHATPTDGMTTPSGTNTYGIRDMDMLFPDFKATSPTPTFISRNMDWVSKVMNGVRKQPYSRIKSLYADITGEDARARGYIKGKMKKEEFFTLLKRTTSATMVYKKQKLDRQDILEITEFDVVVWIKSEMRMMLNEEIARAILIGDGRLTSSDDHIPEDKVRPIAKDVPLFNTTVQVPNLDKGYGNFVDAVIRARKNYKGSGNPDLFTTESVLTELLLLNDNNGVRIYKTIEELKTALRVRDIVTVEVMEGQTLSIASKDHALLGIIVNLIDYTVGADKGGQTTMFEDFDIDFNQEKYLIETQISGALTKPYSAITLVDERITTSGEDTE